MNVFIRNFDGHLVLSFFCQPNASFLFLYFIFFIFKSRDTFDYEADSFEAG